MVDIEELRKQHLETQFDQKEFVLSADNLITAARASGETREEFLDPDNENFQATPAFLCSLASGSTLPIDFPSLGGIPMDGGKAVEIKAPVQPDITLTGKTRLHEIYDKKGRSGRMIFIVVRMDLYNDEEQLLATTDSRLVIREKPDS